MAPQGLPPPDRRQRRDLLGHAPTLECRGVEAGEPGVVPAGLAVTQVPRDLSPLPGSERTVVRAVDRGTDLLAAPAAFEILKLLVEPPARPEQCALHHRPGHAHAR